MNKFETVNGFYDVKLLSLTMVWNAVGRWITENEFLENTGKEYEKEKE